MNTTIDLTPIIMAVIALISAIVTGYVIPLVKSKTTNAQFSEIVGWVKVAVGAAEQLYVGQGRGEEKKAHVLKFLEEKGYKVDTEAIDAMIEAAVNQLNSGNLDI